MLQKAGMKQMPHGMLDHAAQRLQPDSFKKYFIEYKNSSTFSSSPSQRLIDAYAVLGLKPNTAYEEVKRTYRYLMFQNHPDRFEKGDKGRLEEAVAKSKEINIAYEIINDSLNL